MDSFEGGFLNLVYWTTHTTNDGPDSYRNDVVDIATAAAANGLTLNDSFQIKFQFYDNDAFEGNDGYAIDDVQLNCEADLTVYLPVIVKP